MARLLRALLAATMVTSLAAPALAREQAAAPAPQANGQPGYPGVWQGQYPMAYGAPVYGAPVYAQPVYSQPVYSVPVYNGQPVAPQGYMPAPQGYVAAPQGYVPGPQSAAETDPRYREMVDKCQGVARRNSGTTGAVIGGLVGGVVGNRVASGSRAIGTVAGAAVGAVAGGVIGKSVDKSREQECEEFFSSYAPPQAPSYGYAAPAGSYGYPAYGAPAYGYAPGMTGAPMGYVMVPANAPQAGAQQAQGGPCTETRTVSYEYVPVKRRYIGAPPRRAAPRDKRVRISDGS